MGLSTLIKLRENKRDERRLCLADMESRRTECQESLAKIEADLAENITEQQAVLAAIPLCIESMRLLQARRETLLKEKDKAVKALASSVSALSEARTSLNEAVRDLRILENLQARRSEEIAEKEKKTERNY